MRLILITMLWFGLTAAVFLVVAANLAAHGPRGPSSRPSRFVHDPPRTDQDEREPPSSD